MMCDCITEIDKKLADDGLRLEVAFLFSGNSLCTRTYSRLLRKDNGRPETRSGRRSMFAATYCPFCGVKYEDEAEAA